MNVVVDVDVVVNVHVNGAFHSAKTWSKKQDSANLLHQGHKARIPVSDKSGLGDLGVLGG